MPGPVNRKVDRDYVVRAADSSRRYADRVATNKTNELVDILIEAGILILDIEGEYRFDTDNYTGTFSVAKPVVKKRKEF